MNTSSEIIIELKNVNKNFFLESGREFQALQDINLTLYKGEVLALLGPSGSGKSTCLRIMCGLQQASSGEVLSKAKPLVGVNSDVAMVFQSFALLPWENVYQNIWLSLETSGLSTSQKNEVVKKTIDIVGLEGFEEAYPRELSGGMKQRVGLARALSMQRPVLFLDEPFSALDVLTTETLRQEVLKIYSSKQTSIQSMLLVTHNIQEAVLMADRIMVLGTSPGHIKHEFKNSLSYPRNENSDDFKYLVNQIHQSITESYMPDVTSEKKSQPQPQKPQIEILPPVSLIEVIGLLESINQDGGSVDLFALSEEIGSDFGHTLYLVKSAELLNLVDTPKQKVILTDTARAIVNSDISTRKQILNVAFSKLNLVSIVDSYLKESDLSHLPIDDLIEKIQILLPKEDPDKIIAVLISWGRFTEHYGYSDDTKTLYLDLGQDYHIN